MNFLEKVTAILNDAYDIPGLEEGKLIGYQNMDHSFIQVKGILPPEYLKRILRLQTLARQEHDAVADFDNTAVQADTEKRTAILHQLTIELVREAIGAELEQFDVMYFVSIERKLYRRQVSAVQKTQ